MKLSFEQREVHNHAVTLAGKHHEVEADLIATLEKVERLKIHKSLGLRSLFQYATEFLKLDEGVAYALISVSRKSREIPELKLAITQKRVTLSKASRIVASLSCQNAHELIQFAETHSKREIESEIARRNPKAKTRDKAKVLSCDWVELKVSVSPKTLEKLKRVESLLAQKGKEIGWDQVLDQAFEAYLDKNDPVKKAERAQSKKILCSGRENVGKALRVSTSNSTKLKRIPLTAEQKHAVFLRDQGRCTHVDICGKRCNEDRWIDVHHIVPVKSGGTNDPDNLTTLCWSHHDLVHQMEFPLDGSITWFRSPAIVYG